MGIFSKLFNKKKDFKKASAQLVDLLTPHFLVNNDRKLNDTFMSCVDTHAKHCSKIKPYAYLKDQPAKPWLTKILTLSPNPIMEAGAFWEKAARKYYMENNLFIYLDWDLKKPNEPLKSLWILDAENADVRMDGEDIYLRFTLRDQTITTNIENIVHVARNVDSSELFGQGNNAIAQVLKVINTNYQGIDQAIRTSGFLRFILSTTTLLTDDQRKKKAEAFAETYLAKDGTGIAYLDASTTLTQVNSQAKYANADEMKVFEGKIQKYLGISDEILLGNFNENQWQSYYETSIEPFVNKLENELTRKIFTKREYGDGNRIIISSDNLQIASTQTKINLVEKTKELGIFTINEYRKLFNYAPIEGGDVRLASLNFINADKADEYQLGKNKLKNGGNPNESTN